MDNNVDANQDILIDSTLTYYDIKLERVIMISILLTLTDWLNDYNIFNSRFQWQNQWLHQDYP